MKRIVSCLGMATLLFTVSCNKDMGGLSANSWSVSGKTLTAKTVAASASTNYISAADGQGSTLDFSFKALPTTNADFTVNAAAYDNTEVAVRAVLGGNIVYNSIAGTGKYVSLRLTGSQYTVIANDLKLVNADAPKDTVTVSCNLTQQ